MFLLLFNANSTGAIALKTYNGTLLLDASLALFLVATNRIIE